MFGLVQCLQRSGLCSAPAGRSATSSASTSTSTGCAYQEPGLRRKRAQKVYTRTVSERKRIAAQFRSEGEGRSAEILGTMERQLRQIRSTAYRHVQEVRGKVNAEATHVYGAAYNGDPEFYAFSRRLGAYKEGQNKNSTLILTTDSDYYRYLKQAGASRTSRASSTRRWALNRRASAQCRSLQSPTCRRRPRSRSSGGAAQRRPIRDPRWCEIPQTASNRETDEIQCRVSIQGTPGHRPDARRLGQRVTGRADSVQATTSSHLRRNTPGVWRATRCRAAARNTNAGIGTAAETHNQFAVCTLFSDARPPCAMADSRASRRARPEASGQRPPVAGRSACASNELTCVTSDGQFTAQRG